MAFLAGFRLFAGDHVDNCLTGKGSFLDMLGKHEDQLANGIVDFNISARGEEKFLKSIGGNALEHRCGCRRFRDAVSRTDSIFIQAGHAAVSYEEQPVGVRV